MRKYLKNIMIITLLLFCSKAYAIDLGTPISCSYGEDCFIYNYYDKEPKPSLFTDHTCGRLSEDGHKSTDFMLKNMQQMKEGVNVVAADSGEVVFVRDGMGDISVDLIGEEAVRGSECGNGVIIDHKRGYKTEYCHLRQNSIPVKVGEEIEKGQTVGQVGLSGVTTFPYLEFTVSLRGNAIDPFTGDNPVTGEVNVPCDSLDIYPLWDKQTEKRLKYISTSLLSMGFSDKVPYAMGAREGRFSRTEIRNDTNLLVLWADVFGLVAGDQLKLTILGPDGSVLKTETRPFNTNRRHIFQFIGKKSDHKEWPLGEYIGKVELLRNEGVETDAVINSSAIVELVTKEKDLEIEKELEREKDKKRKEQKSEN